MTQHTEAEVRVFAEWHANFANPNDARTAAMLTAYADRLAADAAVERDIDIPISAQDERTAFESYWYNHYHSGSIKARSNGRYFGEAVNSAWDAWQARAALYTPPAAPQVPEGYALLPTHALTEILADADIGPPIDAAGCCLECGQWTPWRHPEAHDHDEGCRAPSRYAQRRNWKARLSALIATASASPTGEQP
ncbi:hypothetical protein N8I74_10870 [Chitiniphilus purpureus]|uniref:Uncharacterized protein n=1 Tax=Chitiniphilus purpureus TaxID=2981137 RepID=A0ABY6DHK8_9NEIS|nr:hypothetical protein [Chitiniphilus sp. CD1]UXY13824.1 hypothetical protein N8I74_10870 [Chitiniphilus sp. CD1]